MDNEQLEALERIAALKQQGILTDAEVEAEKRRILSTSSGTEDLDPSTDSIRKATAGGVPEPRATSPDRRALALIAAVAAATVLFFFVVVRDDSEGPTTTSAPTTVPKAAPTTVPKAAPTTLPPALPLVDLVANYWSEDFLPVASDFATLVRGAGLLPLIDLPAPADHPTVRADKEVRFGWGYDDPEVYQFAGPAVSGEFCPGLSWMAAGLNDKKVSIRRMITDLQAVGESVAAGNQRILFSAIMVTAIHDVDTEEFASALRKISIATGGTSECSTSAKWTSGLSAYGWEYSVVRLRGADLDTETHKIQIGAPEGWNGKATTVDRSVDFFEKEWVGGLDSGQVALAVGHSEDPFLAEVQVLLHLENVSTALHIHLWVNTDDGSEEADNQRDLALLLVDSATSVSVTTVGKLLGWLTAHQIIGY